MITKLIILSVPVFITQPKTAGSFQLKLNPVEIEINNGMLQMMSQLKISNPLYFQNSFVATFIDSPEFPVVKHQRYTVTVVFQIPAVCFDGTTDFDRFDPYFKGYCNDDDSIRCYSTVFTVVSCALYVFTQFLSAATNFKCTAKDGNVNTLRVSLYSKHIFSFI
jgi:hypothetical protein